MTRDLPVTTHALPIEALGVGETRCLTLAKPDETVMNP